MVVNNNILKEMKQASWINYLINKLLNTNHKLKLIKINPTINMQHKQCNYLEDTQGSDLEVE